ncbi:MAG: YegP family protein [Treponema sp.]|nr:YegP family protein [Treponema sp.]
MGKFVIKAAKSGVMFNLLAGNGQVIATSEVYNSKSSAKNGIESVKNNCTAVVEDQTKADYAVEKNPKFEIYKDKKGEVRFRLKAGNGQVIATSEGYKDNAACKNGIESVKKNAPTAEIVDEA